MQFRAILFQITFETEPAAKSRCHFNQQPLGWQAGTPSIELYQAGPKVPFEKQLLSMQEGNILDAAVKARQTQVGRENHVQNQSAACELKPNKGEGLEEFTRGNLEQFFFLLESRQF